MLITTVAFLSLASINGVHGKSQDELGTIHILRKHLLGGRVRNTHFLLIFCTKNMLT